MFRTLLLVAARARGVCLSLTEMFPEALCSSRSWGLPPFGPFVLNGPFAALARGVCVQYMPFLRTKPQLDRHA